MREQSPRSLAFAVVLVVTALLSHQLALSTTNCFVASSLLQTPTPDVPVALVEDSKAENPKAGVSQALTIRDLIETQVETSCTSEKMVLLNNRLLDPNKAFVHAINGTQNTRQIPKIIHVTTKSRCLPKVFADNLRLWMDALPDHSFVLHNDAAMDRLLFDTNNKWQSLFPHVGSILRHCSVSVAAKADLWRALVLWEYGGIYTDIDNAPGPRFNETSIAPTDQAWFVVEEGGFLSQYFMASAPKHPLFFLLIQSTLHRLLDLNDVDHQYVPYVTGPGALKQAFMHFGHLQGPNKASNKQLKNATYFGMVRSGHYVGLGNSTVTVVGRRSQSNDYVARNVIYKKRRIYQQLMNMTHFSRVHSSKEARSALNTDSCLERLWKREAATKTRGDLPAALKGGDGYQPAFW